MAEVLTGQETQAQQLAAQGQQSADMFNGFRNFLEGYARSFELFRQQEREEQKRRDEAQKQRDIMQRKEHNQGQYVLTTTSQD